jgi:hypothetical protein
MTLSRRQLEERVDALAAERSGREFADAVKELHDELGPEEREVLQEIVLARAASLDQAVMERVDARGWFRRQWDRATTPPPRR